MTQESMLKVEEITRRWVENIVIGLNLCPFAKSVYVKDQVKIHVTPTRDRDELTEILIQLLQELAMTPAKEIDTTLLVIPNLFGHFYDFNDYLDIADKALEQLNLQDQLQIANFHPQFQFAGTSLEDMGNYTNRSPYPILHLIREASIDRAVAQFPDAAVIFERNIALMEKIGKHGWQALLDESGEGKVTH